MTKLKYSLIMSCLVALPVKATEIPTNAALMQAMDKVTGRVNKITIPVNSKVSFGDFSLVLRACKKRPAEETPENFAFVDVTDKSFGSEEYNIFRGWLLSSTPGINAIEHPIYDMWLLECVDTNIEGVTLLSEEELKIRDSLPSKTVLAEANSGKQEINSSSEAIIETPKAIRIKDFINEDRDIEKNIVSIPAYISETSSQYVSDIEEGDEPENLLQFTKFQEENEETSKDKDVEEENKLKNFTPETFTSGIRNLQKN